MQRSTNRYAVYWTPAPGEPLAEFGNNWLGRDPSGAPVGARPTLPGIPPAKIDELTAEPARYGFHATLKPPFALAEGKNEDDLLRAVEALAAQTAPVRLDQLEVRAIGKFVAVVAAPAPAALAVLGASCVQALDPFRAPATPEELARRRRAGLTAAQEDLLERWGYPYVMQEFRFHLTLTGPIPDTARPQLRDALSAAASSALGATTISDLCVFTEPAPGEPFTLGARFPLTGP